MSAQLRSLVTGANGFLGQWLVRRLISEGHAVSVLIRNPQSLPEDLRRYVVIHKGDITQPESLEEAFQKKDQIFHLAGLIAYKREELAAMKRVNVDGTRHVIEAMVKYNVPQLLHLSSVVAVGASTSSKVILNEESPYNVGHLHLGYFDTKHEAEKLVIEATKKNLIRSVIINPSTIYGPGDATKGSRKTQIKVARGEFPFYTGGGVSIVDVEDVVSAILNAVKHGRNGERYIIAGDNITIHDLFTMIARAAGVTAPQIYMPTALLKAIGCVGDLMNKVGLKSSISIENAYTASMFHWFSNEKAKKELNFQPRPAYESIEKSVRWMRENKII